MTARKRFGPGTVRIGDRPFWSPRHAAWPGPSRSPSRAVSVDLSNPDAGFSAACYAIFGNNIVDSSERGWDDELVPSWWDGRYLIVAVELFFDEGGSEPRLIVSAQVYSRESVSKIEKQWREECEKFGLRNSFFFHSKNYGNRTHGVFKDLSKTKRKDLLNQLTGLIHKHAECGVSASVNTEEFNRIVPADCKSRWVSAYPFALFACLGSVHLVLARANREHEQVNVLIARGHRNLQQAMAQLSELKATESRIKLRTISDGQMWDHATLQSADILAFSRNAELAGKRHDIPIALSRPRKGSYRTYTIDCDAAFIGLMADGWNKTDEEKVEWGRRVKGGHRVSSKQ